MFFLMFDNLFIYWVLERKYYIKLEKIICEIFSSVLCYMLGFSSCFKIVFIFFNSSKLFIVKSLPEINLLISVKILLSNNCNIDSNE